MCHRKATPPPFNVLVVAGPVAAQCKMRGRDWRSLRNLSRCVGIALLGALSVLSARALEIIGWVPPYAIGTCQTAVNADFGAYDARNGLTRVGLQFWVPRTDGTIKYATHESYVPTDNDVKWWVDWGKANGIKVLLTIYNNTGKWDWNLARSAFAANRATFVKALVAEMDELSLDGIDVDLEGTGRLDSDRAAFAAFITDLSAAVKAHGKILTVDSFHYIWNAPNQNWWPDWLGKVDQIQTMGYDDLYEGGSGYHKYSFQQNAGIAAGFPASAILMGFPSWVDSWGVSSGLGTTTLAHLDEVLSLPAGPAGIAIWDLQLSASSWRSSAVWAKIAAIKEINGGIINDAPVANSQTVVTSKDTLVTITLTGSDPNGDALTFEVLTLPAHGTLAGLDPNALTYTPDPGWTGYDSFTFTVNDGQQDSAPATVTIGVNDGGLGPLPAGWSTADIGIANPPGYAGYDLAKGQFDVAGAGTGITGTADGFRYVWQTMTGDGEVRARLTAMDPLPLSAVAGVMIRETTASGSAHHFLGRRNDGQLVWVRRNSTGRSTSLATGGAAGLPCWVRIVRTGTTITAYRSADGLTWSRVNNAKLSMASQVTVGLAVSSSNSSSLLNTSFDNVRVVP